jgi:hypothetical protein
MFCANDTNILYLVPFASYLIIFNLKSCFKFKLILSTTIFLVQLGCDKVNRVDPIRPDLCDCKINHSLILIASQVSLEYCFSASEYMKGKNEV